MGKSLVEGVGVSMIMKEEQVARGLGVRRLDPEMRRLTEGLRRGDFGDPGDPGWTRAAQAAMAEWERLRAQGVRGVGGRG